MFDSETIICDYLALKFQIAENRWILVCTSRCECINIEGVFRQMYLDVICAFARKLSGSASEHFKDS